MIEIEYKPAFVHHLLHRCYTFYQDPEEPNLAYTFLYVDTNGTFRPIQNGNICIKCIGNFVGHPIRSGVVRLADFFRRIYSTEIDENIETILQKLEKEGNDFAPELSKVYLNLIEAYMQIQEDLKNGVPMHRLAVKE